MIEAYRGRAWRYVPAGAQPLHVGYILKAGGRWNRAGVYGCLYTSTSVEGVIAEWQKWTRLAGQGAERRPQDAVAIEVAVAPVADLHARTFRRRYAITGASFTEDDPSHVEYCRSVADLMRSENYRALHVPSAALDDTTNLIIYLEGPANRLRLEEAGERYPLNHGSNPLLTI